MPIAEPPPSSLPMTDSPTFTSNLEALARFCDATAARLRNVPPPKGVRPIAARDGTPTFVWPENENRLTWLGRTSMPTVRATELVAAFDPGSRNVLLYGLGGGEEVRLLLNRLAPHQAVFVLEDDETSAALALRLRDFSPSLRQGRLLLFVAADPWGEMLTFLRRNAGFLTPERALCWPWFTAADIAALSDRLLTVSAEVATHRAAAGTTRRQARMMPSKANGEAGVAIISNVADRGVLEFAARLHHAAAAAGLPCCQAVLDDPACVHPDAVEQRVWDSRPTHLILLDVLPEGLQWRLPEAATIVTVTHAQPLSGDWLRRIPAAAGLAVRTPPQREQAIAAGIPAERTILLGPAATPGLENVGADPEKGLIVVADGPDPAPESVGLHLSSHLALWHFVRSWIERRADQYVDAQAERALAAAEEHLGIRLHSGEVRQGLLSRIRGVLGPAVIAQTTCRRLLESGQEFALYGDGWSHDSPFTSRWRGRWPLPDALRDLLAACGVAVIVRSGGWDSQAMLDCVAAGLVTLVRMPEGPPEVTADSVPQVLDPAAHVVTYRNATELLRILRSLPESRGDLPDRTAKAAAYVNAAHTWTQRIRELLGLAERLNTAS